MHFKNKKHTITFFFIIAFFLLKVVNLHAFEHISDQDDDFGKCDTCELYTIKQHHNPITVTPEVAAFTPPVFPKAEHLPATYSVLVSKIQTRGYFFNKPPPVIS